MLSQNSLVLLPTSALLLLQTLWLTLSLVLTCLIFGHNSWINTLKMYLKLLYILCYVKLCNMTFLYLFELLVQDCLISCVMYCRTATDLLTHAYLMLLLGILLVVYVEKTAPSMLRLNFLKVLCKQFFLFIIFHLGCEKASVRWFKTWLICFTIVTTSILVHCVTLPAYLHTSDTFCPLVPILILYYLGIMVVLSLISLKVDMLLLLSMLLFQCLHKPLRPWNWCLRSDIRQCEHLCVLAPLYSWVCGWSLPLGFL